jgi:ProP effector
MNNNARMIKANEAVARLADADVTTPVGKRKQRQQQIRATIALLAERWPKTFFVLGKRRKPLKIGLADDIAATVDGTVWPVKLHLTLRSYCASLGYLRNFQEGMPRLDLSGNEAGVVTAADVEHARAKLDEVLARRQPKPQPPATAGAQHHEQKATPQAALQPEHAAADPGRAIAAAVSVALDIAAEAKRAAPTSQPKRGDGFAALKAAAARRRETRGSSA